MCRAYGKSFRRIVLLCVVLLGVYAIFIALYYSSSSRLPLYESDRNYVERHYGRGVVTKLIKAERSGSKEVLYTELLNKAKHHRAEEERTLTTHSTPPKLGQFTLATTTEANHYSTSHLLATSPLSSSSNGARAEQVHPTVSTTGKSTNGRVLLMYDHQSVGVAKDIRVLLQAHRVPHDVYLYSKEYLLPLEDNGKGRYCTIVFSDFPSLYSDWSESHRQSLQKHARTFNVTFISFFNMDQMLANVSVDGDTEFKIGDFFVWLASSKELLGINLNEDINYYYLKTGESVTRLNHNTTYVGINLEDGRADSGVNRVEVLAEMRFKRKSWYRGKDRLPIVVAGELGGHWAGITQVIIGMPIGFWLTKLMFLEVVRSYSKHRSLARFGRERLVMVDVDDIFVAPKGLKMTTGDVEVSGRVRGWHIVGVVREVRV